MSAAGLVPFAAPFVSLLIASTLNVAAAFLLPFVGVYVGLGTAALSLRVMIVTIEISMTILAFTTTNDPLHYNDLLPQMVLLIIYVCFCLLLDVRPWHLYMSVLPASLNGMDALTFIKQRLST